MHLYLLCYLCCVEREVFLKAEENISHFLAVKALYSTNERVNLNKFCYYNKEIKILKTLYNYLNLKYNLMMNVMDVVIILITIK